MKRFVLGTAVAAFALVPSTSNAAGQQLRGEPLCSADSLADTWQLPADEPHGIRQLARTTKIVLPMGVPSLDVELWGAGGGGGAGSIESISEGGYGGGGGASGAYVRAAAAAGPTHELTVVIGRGGDGGRLVPSRVDGQTGGSSAVCESDRVLVSVAGGSGGRAGHANKKGGEGGRGAGPPPNATTGLRKPSNAGASGNAPLFDIRGAGGAGGAAVTGSIQPPAASGGVGGLGASTSQTPGLGAPGGDGYAILRW